MKNFAIKTIKEAGEIVRKKFGHIRNVKNKSRHLIDPVTEADYLSEKKIVNAIKKQYPTHKILSEESYHSASLNEDDLWIIDPLDGTRNFAVGIPFFCIALSYKKKGQTVLDLVYDPLHNELFFAAKGQGAYLNNKAIKVNKNTALSQSVVSYGATRRDFKVTREANRVLSRLSEAKCWLANYGCAALGLCYLACGRTDISFLYNLAPWDIDAAALIAEEAGARVEVYEAAAQNPWYKYRILMANPRLFNKVKDKYIKLKF